MTPPGCHPDDGCDGCPGDVGTVRCGVGCGRGGGGGGGGGVEGGFGLVGPVPLVFGPVPPVAPGVVPTVYEVVDDDERCSYHQMPMIATPPPITQGHGWALIWSMKLTQKPPWERVPAAAPLEPAKGRRRGRRASSSACSAVAADKQCSAAARTQSGSAAA